MPSTPLCVLIVDDSEVTRTVIARNLIKQIPQAVVTPCASVNEAMEQLAQRPFHLITTALQLQDQDGLALVRHVRTHPQHRTTPLVVISSDMSSKRLREGFSEGVTDFFDKRRGHQALAEFLHELLQRQEGQGGRVLYVEDSPSSALRIERLFSRHGLQVTHVLSAEQAQVLLERNLAESGHEDSGFDVVVTDYFLSGSMTGDDLVRTLRTALRLSRQQLPLLVMTANEVSHDITEILHAGANDYIAKPIIDEVLMTRLQSLLIISQQSRTIRRLDRYLAHSLTRDPLTGLANRGHLECEGARLLSTQPLSLMLIDIDHFKALNLNVGDTIADQLLCALADELANTLPKTTLVARLRGDTFGVLIPNTHDLPQQGFLAETLRDHLASTHLLNLRFTVSIGLVNSQTFPDATFNKLLTLASKALLSAKAEGGNQVYSFYQQENEQAS